MNILFLCSRNKWRSRTAETIFKNNGQHIVRSAGTENSARIKVNQKMLDWADVILVMEKKHRTRIVDQYTIEERQIEILDIPDDYTYMDETLVQILKESCTHYF